MTPLPGPPASGWFFPGEVVYFARMPTDPAIKIGTSISWQGRINELRRNGRGRTAFPLLLVQGGQRLELRFHAHFEPHHIGNEWFNPHPDVLEAMLAIHAGVFDWSALPAKGWCVTKPFQTKASLRHWGPLPTSEAA